MNATIEEVIQQEVAKRRPKGVLAAPSQIIAIGTPTLGQISMWWHTSLVDLIWPMNTAKALLPCIDHHGGEIAEIRNRIVSMCMATETDSVKVQAIMWIDDDVIVPRESIMALARHERDIASGVYFTKGEFAQPLIFDGPCSGVHSFRPDETFEAWGWSQGLSLVRLDVYKRIRDELDIGKDKYGAPLWYEPSDFRILDNGSVALNGTEDFPFFEKANKLGYSAIVDCSKHAFGWHYDCVGKTGYPKAQWDQFSRREPVVWPAKNGQAEVIWA